MNILFDGNYLFHRNFSVFSQYYKGQDMSEVLYKVLMGDTSDNIPKIKKGFGDVAFKKYIQSVNISDFEDKSFIQMVELISKTFADFTGLSYEELLDKVAFNLKMTWLKLGVYLQLGEDCVYNGKSLLENMLDDVNANKNTYTYNKEYTLEAFYGMMIK